MINSLVRKAKKMLVKAVSAKNVRNDFYRNRIYFRRMLQFFKIVNEAGDHVKTTLSEISPLGLSFGSDINSIKKEMGAEKYFYDNRKSAQHHRVIFYRRKFGEVSLLVQLQFFNNRLFFIGLDVLTRLIDDEEKTEIINTVIQKYLKQPYLQGEAYPLIRDAKNNFILINDDIHFSICYVAGDLNEQLQEKIIDSMENVLKIKSEKNSLFYAF